MLRAPKRYKCEAEIIELKKGTSHRYKYIPRPEAPKNLNPRPKEEFQKDQFFYKTWSFPSGN